MIFKHSLNVFKPSFLWNQAIPEKGEANAIYKSRMEAGLLTFLHAAFLIPAQLFG